MVTDVFIKRPILATVCSVLITLAGAICDSDAAHRPLSRACAADGDGRRLLHRRERAGRRKRGHHAARIGHQRRRGHALHDLGVDQQRLLSHHGDVRSRPRSRSRRGRCAEPRELRARPHAARGAHQRHHRLERVGGFPRRHRLLLRQQPVQLALHQQLPRPVRARWLEARAGRRERHHLRRAALCDAAVARSEPSRRTRPDGERRHQRAARAERAGGRGLGRRAAVFGRPDVPAQRARGRAADRSARVRRHRRESGSGRRARARARHRPRRAGRRRLLLAAAIRRRRSVGHRHHAAADGERARSVPRHHRRNGAHRGSVSAGPEMAAGVRQRRRRARVDHRSAEDARRSDRARHPRDVPVPAELAQHADSRDHDPGVAHRHVRVREAARLLDQHADALRHRARDGHRRRRCDRRD